MKYPYHCIFFICLIAGISQHTFTCSSLRLKAKDGSIVYARTMDFPQETEAEIIAVPRNVSFVGTLPGNKKGLNWKNKYGILGVNGLHVDHITDGINEKGLVCGLFYFPHYAEFQPLNAQNTQQSIAFWELGTFLLSTCATVQDVRKIITTISVVETPFENQRSLSAHYIVHDTQGNSLVIEYIKGKLTLYDNPYGVITNSPSFDWHMTNINNYLHLFTPQTKKLTIAGIELASPGEGSNFIGLPGDFTPPSRFVRLTVLSQTSVALPTAAECINQAINIMNNVTVPRGPVTIDDAGKKKYDYTQWMTVYDVTNKRLYYRTYDNPNFRYIDGNKVSFEGKTVKRIPMAEPAHYVDYSGKFR
jgi:choloylglycine hydrolase